MDARKPLHEAASGVTHDKPTEKTTTAEILRRADISKQTPCRSAGTSTLQTRCTTTRSGGASSAPTGSGGSRTDGRIYGRQFHRYLEHLDFVRHLFSSRVTDRTTNFEIRQTLAFYKALLRRRNVDLPDQRILFAPKAKDVGGTHSLRTWILGGVQTPDEEMVTRFELVIPQMLVPYF